jgi:hypothetical protein
MLSGIPNLSLAGNGVPFTAILISALMPVFGARYSAAQTPRDHPITVIRV